MLVSFPILLGICLIVLSLLLRPYILKTQIPYPLVLTVIGFVVSEIAVASGFDVGLRADISFSWGWS